MPVRIYICQQYLPKWQQQLSNIMKICNSPHATLYHRFKSAEISNQLHHTNGIFKFSNRLNHICAGLFSIKKHTNALDKFSQYRLKYSPLLPTYIRKPQSPLRINYVRFYLMCGSRAAKVFYHFCFISFALSIHFDIIRSQQHKFNQSTKTVSSLSFSVYYYLFHFQNSLVTKVICPKICRLAVEI